MFRGDMNLKVMTLKMTSDPPSCLRYLGLNFSFLMSVLQEAHIPLDTCTQKLLKPLFPLDSYLALADEFTCGSCYLALEPTAFTLATLEMQRIKLMTCCLYTGQRRRDCDHLYCTEIVYIV